MLDFRIETFLKLCENKSYTATARDMHITQPTVTQQIQFLERYYGAKLFEYTGKMLYLTEKGEVLRQYALGMRASSISLMEDIANKGERVLRFGVTKTIGEFIMPSLIKNYLGENPSARISMSVDNTKHLLSGLEEGAIDFAVVEGLFDKAKYDYEIFKNEKFIGVCSPKSKFCGRKTQMSELLENNIVVREEGSGTREVLEQVLREKSLRLENFKNIIDIGNFSCIKEVVKADIGITFVYKPVVEKEIAQGSLCTIDIDGFSAVREFNVVYLKNYFVDKSYKKLFQYVE